MHDEVEDRLQADLLAGREDAFAALYDRFGRPLYRVACTTLRSAVDAEDAVQEVFLGLVRSRSTLGRIENLRAYLFSALRHAVSRLAARKKVESLPPDDPSVPTPAAVDADLSDALERGLAALPAEQREVLSLKIDGELTFAEVAAVLGIRPNTAASRYRYALEKLRAFVKADSHESRSTAS